jgi:very-short-patch-repair endonuclease
MSRKFGIDKIVEEVLSQIEGTIRGRFEFDVEGMPLGSPIEKLFFVAMIQFINGPLASMTYIDRWYVDKELKEPDVDGEISIGLQQKVIGKWPVDFLFVYRQKGEFCRVVVECDGHQFHESTKEQAKRDRSRDRELQALGYYIFRFTGSEIYNEPIKCAEEVEKLIVRFDLEKITGES